MMFLFLLVPCLLVALIVVAAGSGAGLFAGGLQGLRLPSLRGSSARDIVARRYAQGEISKDQYDQILADLAD